MPPRRSSALQCFSFSKSTNKLSINQLQMTTLLLHWCLIRKKIWMNWKFEKKVLFHKYNEVWRFLARSKTPYFWAFFFTSACSTFTTDLCCLLVIISWEPSAVFCGRLLLYPIFAVCWWQTLQRETKNLNNSLEINKEMFKKGRSSILQNSVGPNQPVGLRS